jgi:hypothetical protein
MSLLIDHQTLGADVVEQSARLPQETPPKPPKLRPSRPLSSFVKVSTLTGLGFFAVLFAAEHAAPSPWKPSTVIGAFGGNEKSAQMLASLEADRALVAMQEQEKGRALQETEILRANQERLTRAYQAEYDRGTELIKAGAAAAQQLWTGSAARPRTPTWRIGRGCSALSSKCFPGTLSARSRPTPTPPDSGVMRKPKSSAHGSGPTPS